MVSVKRFFSTKKRKGKRRDAYFCGWEYDQSNEIKYLSLSLTQKNQIGLQNRPINIVLDAIGSAITFRKRCGFFEKKKGFSRIFRIFRSERSIYLGEKVVFLDQQLKLYSYDVKKITETLSCLNLTNFHLFSFETVKKWLKCRQREV